MPRTVYTGGTFDCFHHGHVNFLSQCASYGPVTVGLNTDAFVYEFKSVLPRDPLAVRMQMLSGCKYVHTVRINEAGRNSADLIAKVNPSIICIGSDWHSKDYLSQLGISQAFLDNRGIHLIYIPYTPGVSSTLIRGLCGSA